MRRQKPWPFADCRDKLRTLGYQRLVIFPMSRNNTSETSDFADPLCFSEGERCATLSHSVLMEKIIAKHKT